MFKAGIEFSILFMDRNKKIDSYGNNWSDFYCGKLCHLGIYRQGRNERGVMTAVSAMIIKIN